MELGKGSRAILCKENKNNYYLPALQNVSPDVHDQEEAEWLTPFPGVKA